MNKVIGIPIKCLGAVVLLVSGCRPPGPAERETEPPLVRTRAVQPEAIVQWLEAVGDIHPVARVHVAAKVGGRLERLGRWRGDDGVDPLHEGDRITRGTVLAHIDRSTYGARLRQARAALAQAEIQVEDARREQDRVERLFQEGSATEQMRDRASTARRAAEAALEQARAVFELATIEYEESAVQAPVDGTVTRVHVDEGNLVSPGTPLVTLEDLSRVKLIVAVAERYQPMLRAGATRVEIRSDALPEDATVTATVARVYPAVDPATRTVTVECVLENPDLRWRSGNFARVRLAVAEIPDALVLPISAIVWQGRDAHVFLAENGRAVRREVRTGIRDGDRIQIREGLRPGDLVIVTAAQGLKDGDPIRVAPVDAEANHR